jgi:hypothetical protein
MGFAVLLQAGFHSPKSSLCFLVNIGKTQGLGLAQDVGIVADERGFQ